MRAANILIIPICYGLIACTPKAATHASRVESSVGQEDVRGTALPSLAPMLRKISSAVVNISVEGTVEVSSSSLMKDPAFRHFFHLPATQTPLTERFHSVGSGVVFDAKHGYVLTNDHVISNADKIQVTLSDGRQLTAALVASDAKTDVAVLKIVAERLTELPFGRSKTLQVGDYVVAIGDPFGVGQAATFGIVSAVGRNDLGIEGYEDFIQTDASINPGNSGGALVDMTGQLVGINTAILSRSNGNMGVGFAIPIDMASAVAEQLIAHGRVSRGEFGVALQSLTPQLARAFGIEEPAGALVSEVKPGSAAERAGLQDGDVVTALNGQPILNSGQLRNAIGEEHPRAHIALSVLRNGRRFDVAATLSEPKLEEPKTARAAMVVSASMPQGDALSGISLAPIPMDNEFHGKIAGVYVANIAAGSGAAEAGLQQGDIITSADQTSVITPKDLARIVQAEKKDKPVLLRIQRGNSAFFAALG